MRLYWKWPESQRIPHAQKILCVEFTREDHNVWHDGGEAPGFFYTIEWAPTYDEILAILKELLKGEKSEKSRR